MVKMSIRFHHAYYSYLVAGRNFVVKCGGDSLVGNQYGHRVDAEVTFYIYIFPILFLEVF